MRHRFDTPQHFTYSKNTVIAILEYSGLFLTLKVAGKRRFTITKSNQIQNIMSKKVNTFKPAYVAPGCKFFSMKAQSVLCTSNPDYKTSNYIDDVDEEDLGTL